MCAHWNITEVARKAPHFSHGDIRELTVTPRIHTVVLRTPSLILKEEEVRDSNAVIRNH